MALLGRSEGTLGARLPKLEEGVSISVVKEFRNGKPASRYTLADPGRQRLRSHLNLLRNS